MRTGERTDIHNTVDYTVDLTKELEDGTISMEDYLDERAKRVGRGNILQFVTIVFVANIMVQTSEGTYIPLGSMKR